MYYIENDNKILLFDDDKQRLQNTIAVIPQYQGLEIQEVKEGYVIYDFELMTVAEKEEKETQKERERLNLLSMTKREMFLGLYQAKQITPDMLKAQITDSQALIEFEYANDYYRGNPLIDIIGGQLGFTSEQLDRFFETKDYKELLPAEEDNSTEQASDASLNGSVGLEEGLDDNTTDTAQSDVQDDLDTTTSKSDETDTDIFE